VTGDERLRERCDVLHVGWSGRIGGIERVLEGIARSAAAREGYAHRVCFLDGRGPIGDRLVEERLAIRLALRRGYDFQGLWRLTRVLRRTRPRFLHFHTHALGAHLVALAALPRAIRIYSEHSPRALRRDRKFLLLYLLLRRTTAAFVATTAGIAHTLARRGIDPGRIAVIPNGVPVPRRTDRRGRAKPPRVGVVARLERQKRLDLFLDVVAELRRRGVDCGGLVVGDGSLRGDLIRQRDALGLGRVVQFTGEQEDTVPWLDRLDVFLMTSEFEPFGIAALEAMARGVPVVAMPCPGGLAELVGRGGLLLIDRDVTTAADDVGRVLGSAGEQERLRARGEAILKEHSFEIVVERLDELYRMLDRSPSGGTRDGRRAREARATSSSRS
jgi:glycosyltransferase involved in cell wall biosynthesis